MKRISLIGFVAGVCGGLLGAVGMQWYLAKNPAHAETEPSARPWENDGSSADVFPGMFSMIAAGDMVYKLDTVRGKAWFLSHRKFTPKGHDLEVKEVVWREIHENGFYLGKDGKQLFTVGSEIEVKAPAFPEEK